MESDTEKLYGKIDELEKQLKDLRMKYPEIDQTVCTIHKATYIDKYKNNCDSHCKNHP